MRATIRTIVFAATALSVGLSGVARAEEADDYTCRSRLSKDAVAVLDSWVNAKIRETLDDVNRRAGNGCDAACLFAELRGAVGGSYPHPVTMIPHSRFTGWINDRKDVERCHLKFGETIYGAKAYNQVWLYPFNGRIIFIADSIRLAGRTVGLDKIDHFIREGLDHWREVNERGGGDIAASVAREMGPAKKQLSWTEYGLKGMSLTGVVAYADIAAGYWGYRFWDELLSLGRPESYIAYDAATRHFSQRRPFTFADFVNDAWDEGINYSTFDPGLAKEVAATLKKRGLTMPVSDCRGLASLAQARLYVNPGCLERVQGSKGPRVPRVPDRTLRTGPWGPFEPDLADPADRTPAEPLDLWTLGPYFMLLSRLTSSAERSMPGSADRSVRPPVSPCTPRIAKRPFSVRSASMTGWTFFPNSLSTSCCSWSL